MNKTKIDWAEYSWNPVTGCRHDCSYCYARKMSMRFSGDIRLNKTSNQYEYDTQNDLYVLDNPFATRNNRALNYPFGFEPTLHKYRLDWPKKLKNGRNIFVGSMCDLFGDWVPDEWIELVFEACDKYSQHNYMFLTKNPKRYMDLVNKGIIRTDDNFWYGSTVTTPDTEYFWHSKLNTFVSIEPIKEPMIDKDAGKLIPKVNWVIVGAETGNQKDKVIPERSWIKDIQKNCKENNIPLFMKESLIDIVGQENMVQEFPELLKHQVGVESQKDSAWYKLNYDKCCICKKEIPKKGHIAILARGKRGTGAKHLAYACPDCFDGICKRLEVDTPDIEL